MKSYKLLPYLMGLLLLASCSDDDQDPTPDAANCLPTKIVNTTDGETEESTLTYDAQGRITKASLSGGEMEGDVFVQYTNNLPTSADLKSGSFTFGSFTYDYDTQNRLTKLTTEIAVMSLKLETTFEYNAQNKIGKAVEYSYFNLDGEEEPMEIFSQYTTFTYDAKGNITKKSVYEGETEEEATLSYTVDYTYDNAPNPGAKAEILLTGYSTPNNVKTASHKYADGEEDETLSYSVAYVYNASGLPTKATETTKSGSASVSNITYSCK
ncbi:hypothetical protein [Rufibacter roseus]|uniref:DUF4595 domain-containing protein n=1 Tax=Rufibacter roseus TaxID=1567108 RepID=A0ABW2DJS0_9BACT|nr:hypothetical protein [Rufibacter roseus]